MKKLKIKQLLSFMFIVMMYFCFSGFIVYADDPFLLFENDGSTPGKWTNGEDYIDRASSLNDGPSSGNPGYFYYFRNSDDDSRELFDETTERRVVLSDFQKTLYSLGQLYINYSVDYYGWNGQGDWFRVALAYNSDSYKNGTYISDSNSNGITGTLKWKNIQKPVLNCPRTLIQ
ncbi:hypothetical protein [Lutispora thermophila]|uniref:Uncharacterized protein n=1 Tax=Lutispora thermophila DSM 19022 TaxID=1122184 RepID=A0A1M6I279_9FIRM|nr:hypothetical protein [Lutispora thermophila]SHJ28566.1 hypothetical protein SAMN02745176_03054 [Lutispora thermophila DSM 19022]